MSAAQDLSVLVTSAAHRRFNEALERIDAVIAYQFRRWPRGLRQPWSKCVPATTQWLGARRRPPA